MRLRTRRRLRSLWGQGVSGIVAGIALNALWMDGLNGSLGDTLAVGWLGAKLVELCVFILWHPEGPRSRAIDSPRPAPLRSAP